jgi:transposase
MEGMPKDWREWRRFQALRLKQQGWRQRRIAEALSVSEVSVSQWMARASSGGPETLRARPSPGHPCALLASQFHMIPEFLWHGPEAYGFRGEIWTCARIARVIQQEFGVAYHKGHVSRLLRQLHWTPQMPVRQASQRDEKAIAWWRKERWPQLLEEAKNQRRTLVFADEAGFYLLPSVMKTYAPCACTPVLRAKWTRDHLSVMGGMTPAGRVYTLVRQESLNGWHSVEFLMHLLRVAGRRLLVIWDGSPIHRRIMVREFVSKTRAIQVETLPGYAPDLNPWDEGGWNHLKNAELRNLACRDLEELHEELHLAVNRLRHKSWLIPSFFAQAGLPLEKT